MRNSIFIIPVLFLFSCGSSKDISNEDVPVEISEETSVVTIDDSSIEIVAEIPDETDPEKVVDTIAGIQKSKIVEDFSGLEHSAPINIVSTKILKNNIIIEVTYSGGCEEHEFELLGSKNIQKSFPPKRGIRLVHHNNGDTCREFIEETLVFEISNLSYSGGDIILNLEGYAYPLTYSLAK